LGDYLLRAGTSVGRMFNNVKLNRRVDIKRNRRSYTDRVYKCRARCTLGSDGWIETGQDCNVELGGWESYLRHMKQVHIKVKREDCDMLRWAKSESHQFTFIYLDPDTLGQGRRPRLIR
jgi:nicotinic acid mononucleotide adenylyltransferase